MNARKIFRYSIIIVIAGLGIYFYSHFYWEFGSGTKAGTLNSFMRKGYVFKTYEGEMIQLGFGQRGAAINSQYYYFSVSDEQLADSLEHCLGKIVKLHYTQYRRSLPWRGENYDKTNADKGQYMVDGIAEVKNASY